MKNWVKILISVLFICFIALYACFNAHKSGIYAYLGKFYSNHNDYVSAQKYYEKSYLLGNNDSGFRECYVNLLINSPLTVEAQEKLVSIADGKIQDSASETAKYFLSNMRKEINNKYRNNYIKQASYNQKIVHWGKVPITYTFKHTNNVPKEIIDAVNDAFDAWERASSARIKFERTQINADIVVLFVNNKIEDAEYGKKYVIAYTIPDISQNKLNRMDMTLNITNLNGKPYTPNQMYNTALHEVMHALGFLGHSSNKQSIMYMTRTNEEIIDDTRKEISDADKITLELFYKIKPDITNAYELTYDYIPYPVVGNSSTVNDAKADEAKSYIRKAPTIPAGYIDLAQTLINEKRYGEAIANLEKAYSLSDNNDAKYLSLYNLAVANYLDGSYELALFYVTKAQEIKDEDELHFLLAEIYLKQKNEERGLEEYKYLVSRNPNNIDYVVNYANIYIKKRQYIKARKILKEFINRNPQEKNNKRFKPCRLLLL